VFGDLVESEGLGWVHGVVGCAVQKSRCSSWAEGCVGVQLNPSSCKTGSAHPFCPESRTKMLHRFCLFCTG